MKSTIVSLNADVSPAVEERCVRWMTYTNLNAWFDNFQAFLIEFDFTGVGDNGEPTFTGVQLRRIMNVVETEISLDTSNTRAGGRPAVSLHDPHLSLTSRYTAKSSLACTGIFGSSAEGECVPPHFQLPMSGTAEEREKIRFEFLTHTLDTRGRFGCAEERIWPCTIGMNEKGGMPDEEFEKYIDNSIIPLYPNLEDTPGKRILLKVDSSPGRNGRELLVKCRFHGLYIYSGLPNATSVQQETDLNYAITSEKYCRLSTLPIYRYPSTRQRLGSLFMAVPSRWAPCRPSLAETPLRRRLMWH